MRFRTFFFWNALGGLTWGVTFGLVGYFAGTAAADVITRFGIYAAVLLAIVAVVGFGYLKVRERRHRQQDAARVDRGSDSRAS
jgi:membrane protein DedA with SNARE-associated domain